MTEPSVFARNFLSSTPSFDLKEEYKSILFLLSISKTKVLHSFNSKSLSGSEFNLFSEFDSFFVNQLSTPHSLIFHSKLIFAFLKCDFVLLLLWERNVWRDFEATAVQRHCSNHLLNQCKSCMHLKSTTKSSLQFIAFKFNRKLKNTRRCNFYSFIWNFISLFS